MAIWVAVGIAVYLLPEAARRAAEGRDPRPALARAVGIVGAVALPVLLIFATVPDLLLRVALGPDFERASSALLLLGLAMSLLALVNLGSQYMLALFQYKFLFLLGGGRRRGAGPAGIGPAGDSSPSRRWCCSSRALRRRECWCSACAFARRPPGRSARARA